MKISVIVPVYNVLPYIKEFLDSLTSQTFKDFEAVLVDDGSTDGTGNVLDEYACKYPFMRVIHKPNGGCMSAWKKGLEYAKGEYITFADPDDVLTPDIYEQEYRAVSETGADLLICGVSALVDGKIVDYNICSEDMAAGVYCGERLSEIKNRLFGNEEHERDLFHFLKMNKLFDRKLIFDNLRYSKDGIAFGEDVCISAAAILDCARLYYFKKPLYLYRIRSGSLTRLNFAEQEADNSLRIINAVGELLDSKGYDKKFARIYGQSYHISRLIKKISVASATKKERKKMLDSLSSHSLVTTFDLSEAKKYLGMKRYFTVNFLKKRWFGILLLLGKQAAPKNYL